MVETYNLSGCKRVSFRHSHFLRRLFMKRFEKFIRSCEEKEAAQKMRTQYPTEESMYLFEVALSILDQFNTGLPMNVFVNEGWTENPFPKKEIFFQTNRGSFSKDYRDYASISLDDFFIRGLGESYELSQEDLKELLLWVKEKRADLLKVQEGLTDMSPLWKACRYCSPRRAKLKALREAQEASLKIEMSVTLTPRETNLPVDIRVDNKKDLEGMESRHHFGLDTTGKFHGTFGEIIFPVLTTRVATKKEYFFGTPKIKKKATYSDITDKQVREIVQWLVDRTNIIMTFKLERNMSDDEYKRRLLQGK